MQRTRKVGKLLVLLFVMMMVVAACGGNNNEKNGANPPKDTKPDEAKIEDVTIKLHTWNQIEQENLEPVIADFEQKNAGIKVEIVNLSEKGDSVEALQKLDLLASAGDEMDVIMLPNAASYAQRASIGMLEPLDPFIAQEGIDPKNLYKIDTTFNEQVFAFPGKYIEWFVMINKEHLDEANLPVPTDWTWDEYLEYANQMTKGEGAEKRYGSYFHNWIDFFRLALVNQQENNGFISDSGESNIQHPMLKKSFELLVQAQNIDKSTTPYAEIISQKLNYNPQYFNQDASMITMGNWMIANAGGTEAIPANFVTVFAPFPKSNDEDEIGYTLASSDYIAMAAKSKNKEEAYKFIRYFTTEGIGVQGRYLSSWKDEDSAAVLESIIAATPDPDKIDKASLLHVVENSKGGKVNVPVTFQAELEKTVIAEAELMLLGDQDIDKTIENLDAKVQALIKANE